MSSSLLRVLSPIRQLLTFPRISVITEPLAILDHCCSSQAYSCVGLLITFLPNGSFHTSFDITRAISQAGGFHVSTNLIPLSAGSPVCAVSAIYSYFQVLGGNQVQWQYHMSPGGSITTP